MKFNYFQFFHLYGDNIFTNQDFALENYERRNFLCDLYLEKYQNCFNKTTLIRIKILSDTNLDYLKPVLPEIAAKVENILNCEPITWGTVDNCLKKHKINAFEPLITRINKESIEKMKDENMKEEVVAEDTDKLTIDDFIKVDLRVAKVINAKELEDSRKLLELEVDLGDETRTIFAGIKKSYTPEQLIGKLVVVIANLKPRKMKFGVSNGMVLATQHDGDIIILQPEKDVAPGSKIS